MIFNSFHAQLVHLMQHYRQEKGQACNPSLSVLFNDINILQLTVELWTLSELFNINYYDKLQLKIYVCNVFQLFCIFIKQMLIYYVYYNIIIVQN